ncbi:MAG: HNH/ENDO VII family nuclease [Monoglobaceae bacterium]
MKRLIALILVCTLLTGCVPQRNSDSSQDISSIPASTQPETPYSFAEEETPEFSGLDDATLLPYLEDRVYLELVTTLNNEEYFVENVSAVYISKEYLEEIAYNSQENIYFGYTLSELDSYFQGTRYVFTLGDDGQTIVTEFQKYDDTYDQILKNVAIGTGVILICVTVSVVTYGAGAPAVSMIFAASAKTGTIMALSSGVFSGASAGIVKGIETGDFDESMKAAVLAGSEGFKWGAISGSIAGGAGEAIALKGATLNGLTMNQAARIQKESGYPLSVIKQFHTMKEYEVFKQAGLQAEMVGGNLTLVRPDIDLYDVVDEYGRNNFTRLSNGLNPIDSAGNTFQWHHIGQENDATLALLTATEHDEGALHGFKVISEIDRVGFNSYKKTLNKDLLKWLLSIDG